MAKRKLEEDFNDLIIHLPTEIWNHVSSFLNPKSLCVFMRVNRFTYQNFGGLVNIINCGRAINDEKERDAFILKTKTRILDAETFLHPMHLAKYIDIEAADNFQTLWKTFFTRECPQIVDYFKREADNKFLSKMVVAGGFVRAMMVRFFRSFQNCNVVPEQITDEYKDIDVWADFTSEEVQNIFQLGDLNGRMVVYESLARVGHCLVNRLHLNQNSQDKATIKQIFKNNVFEIINHTLSEKPLQLIVPPTNFMIETERVNNVCQRKMVTIIKHFDFICTQAAIIDEWYEGKVRFTPAFFFSLLTGTMWYTNRDKHVNWPITQLDEGDYIEKPIVRNGIFLNGRFQNMLNDERRIIIAAIEKLRLVYRLIKYEGYGYQDTVYNIEENRSNLDLLLQKLITDSGGRENFQKNVDGEFKYYDLWFNAGTPDDSDDS